MIDSDGHIASGSDGCVGFGLLLAQVTAPAWVGGGEATHAGMDDVAGVPLCAVKLKATTMPREPQLEDA